MMIIDAIVEVIFHLPVVFLALGYFLAHEISKFFFRVMFPPRDRIVLVLFVPLT
jgi:hypothetical protein